MEISVEHQPSNPDEETEPIIILDPDQEELGESYMKIICLWIIS